MSSRNMGSVASRGADVSSHVSPMILVIVFSNCMIAIDIDLNAGLLILTTYIIMYLLAYLVTYVRLFLLCDI